MKVKKKYSVLIVDDVPKNIQLVASFLTQEGYAINFAQNGEAALKHAFQKDFDLILLDVMMPGLDGFEVCRQLKENKKTRDIPVIFLTAKADDQDVAEGFKLGGVDYVTKPFNGPELIARVRTHLALRDRETQLHEMNKTKDTLLSIIGHDLKSPISNIITMGEVILADYKDYSIEELLDLLKDLVESAKLGYNLLENLLSWTRVQTGKIHLVIEEVEVDDIINSNIAFIKPNALAKSIQIKTGGMQNLKMFVDLNVTNTILRNLLSNAVKFSNRDSEVKVIVEKQGDYVRLDVIDQGVGIAPDRIEDLFNPDSTTTTPGTENEIGTGLGLVLTRQLIEAQRGRVEVNSKVGEGTTFSVYLPSKREEN